MAKLLEAGRARHGAGAASAVASRSRSPRRVQGGGQRSGRGSRMARESPPGRRSRWWTRSSRPAARRRPTTARWRHQGGQRDGGCSHQDHAASTSGQRGGILRDRMIFNMARRNGTRSSRCIWTAPTLTGPPRPTCASRSSAASYRCRRSRARSRAPQLRAAKAGIIGLSWSTANGMAKYNVTSNAIMPAERPE